MNKYLSVLLVLCMLFAASPARNSSSSSGDREADLRSIVEAERGFARLSVEQGTRAAFIENLADDSVIFRPEPVNGKKWWSERPSRPGVLSWRPIFADVSRAGDLGYTTGPWEFREKSVEDKPVAFGQYVTIWKRQATGAWKVAVDLGTSNPQPTAEQTPAPEVKFPADNGAGKRPKPKIDEAAVRTALLKMEDEYSKRVATKKTLDAFLSFLADDVRVFRTEAFPAAGKEAARSLLQAKPGVLIWQSAKADVSLSGDMGYTYGSYELKAADGKGVESGNYLRIWKRQVEGKWKVVLDILNPVPPKAAAG
jgi:ketosteroid isomerase-like protein